QQDREDAQDDFAVGTVFKAGLPGTRRLGQAWGNGFHGGTSRHMDAPVLLLWRVETRRDVTDNRQVGEFETESRINSLPQMISAARNINCVPPAHSPAGSRRIPTQPPATARRDGSVFRNPA
nr:hypothetical protein [Tanacetum cinerariifolium]